MQACLELLECDGQTLRSRHRLDLNPLYEIAAAEGTSKLFHPGYMEAYWTHWASLRAQSVRLVEIGVEQGRSLRMWRRFFTSALLFGIDKNPVPETLDILGFKMFIGCQEDPGFLARFVAETGGCFDIIIDDGSHEPPHQQASLVHLWPHLRPGGWYVIEDLEYSYRNGVLPNAGATTELLKAHVDFVNRDYLRKHGVLLRSELNGLGAMYFYPNICFLRKVLN